MISGFGFYISKAINFLAAMQDQQVWDDWHGPDTLHLFAADKVILRAEGQYQQ